MWNAVTVTEMPDMKHKQRKWVLWQADVYMRACAQMRVQIRTNRMPRSCLHLHKYRDKHAHTWISQVVYCVSSASVGASISSPNSTCGAIISWHTYPPLNDFSSSSASHLIKVESLMPFRDPTAFNCIHCHYENEWRQLRTQMFFHIMTESLSMRLMIFTATCLWLKALVGDSTNHVTHLTHYLWFLYLLCVSPSHPLSVSLAYVLLIEIISVRWKEHRQKGNIKFRSTWSWWSLLVMTERWLHGV